MTRGLKRFCKDCEPGSKRPAPHPGPRCATHHKARQKALREAAHSRSIYERYGLTKKQYEALYEAQGGVCFICQRAKGTGRRKLAVDHDHATGYVRGLLCLAPPVTTFSLTPEMNLRCWSGRHSTCANLQLMPPSER